MLWQFTTGNRKNKIPIFELLLQLLNSGLLRPGQVMSLGEVGLQVVEQGCLRWFGSKQFVVPSADRPRVPVFFSPKEGLVG